jgi:peptidoglycan/LPS O-acetylase OafA/YrhL
MENTGVRSAAASKPAISDAFRFDINALRALSVVAVVGFHFQIPGFAGGFVGVDVFLVITGYLMTAKVLNELKLGRFSPWTFWMMRMRRIYPALAVLTIASVIAGWFVTLPAEYTRHLLQALSALTFLSNFAFKSETAISPWRPRPNHCCTPGRCRWSGSSISSCH